MRIRWRVLRQELLPSSGTLTLLGAGMGLLIIGFSCALLFSITAEVEDPGGTAGFILSFFVLPLGALVSVIGAFRDKRPAPRAVMWFMAAVFIATSGAVASLAMSFAPEVGVSGGGFMFFICWAPLALVLLLPSIYFSTKAWPQLRSALQKERERCALEIIETRGEVTFAEIAQELGMNEEKVEDLIESLSVADKLKFTLYRQQKRVYATLALAKRQRRLLAVIGAHGEIHVEELAAESDVPLSILKEWLYQLVQRGRFTGYINWDEGLLYSEEAEKLREAGRCPQCGGELGLAGKGVIRCQYCGAEIFL